MIFQTLGGANCQFVGGIRTAKSQHRYFVLEVNFCLRPELSAALANPLAKPPRFGEPGQDGFGERSNVWLHGFDSRL